MITSIQRSCKCGEVTVEEDSHVMNDLVVGFAYDHREGLVCKLRGNLVNGEGHSFDLKSSDFGALGCDI